MAKLGISSNLFRSICVLTLFWLIVGFFIYSFIPVDSMNEYYDPIGFVPTVEVTVLNQIEVFFDSIEHRTKSSLVFIIGGLLFSILSLFLYFFLSIAFRKGHSRSDTYMDMFCKITKIPRTRVYLLDSKNGPIKATNKSHQPLLNELLSYAKSHKSYFIGHAHGSAGLYKHTVSVVNKAKSLDGAHDLLELAAAAHDLGKVVTFDGEVPNGKYHDVEGGKILRRMSKLETLPYTDQVILLLSITYQHHKEQAPKSLPSLTEEQYLSFQELLKQLTIIDGSTTSDEKKIAVESQPLDLDKALYDSLKNLIITAPFYSSSSNRKTSNVGYRWGKNLFLFEFMVREYLCRELPEPITKQLDLDVSTAKRVSEGMKRFFKLLDTRGMLVTQAETANGDVYEVPSDAPFWDIKSGDYDFKAMIVIRIVDELEAHLPQESAYPVQITSPFKMSLAKKVSTSSSNNTHDAPETINQYEGPIKSTRKSRQLNINNIENEFTSSAPPIESSSLDSSVEAVLEHIELNTETTDLAKGTKDASSAEPSTKKLSKNQNGKASKTTDQHKNASKSKEKLPPNLF